jgi:GTP-binding protein
LLDRRRALTGGSVAVSAAAAGGGRGGGGRGGSGSGGRGSGRSSSSSSSSSNTKRPGDRRAPPKRSSSTTTTTTAAAPPPPPPPRAAAPQPKPPPPDAETLALLSAAEADPLAPLRARLALMDQPFPSAEHSRIRSLTMAAMSPDLRSCPPSSSSRPEFALIGRSNVGKSSLINALASPVPPVARTSREPGKTRAIHHYLANGGWFLVDLPGYGFARAGKDERAAWASAAQRFFAEREALAAVLLLVDGSVAPQEADLECASWLADAEVPFAVVFTKADAGKKKRTGQAPPEQNARAFRRLLAEAWGALPPTFVTSAETGQGRSEVLQYLAAVRALYLATGGR